MHDDEYFKEYAAKLAKNPWQELLKKSTADNIAPTPAIIKKNTIIDNTPNSILLKKRIDSIITCFRKMYF